LWWSLITLIQLAFVHLSTVQLQLDSYTKTLDSVNFARTHFIQLSQLLARLFKTSLNKLFQLKYILLMIFPAFVRSGNCDKSQRLSSPRIITLVLANL